jgi:CRISPR-associated protein Cas5t
MNSVCLKVSVPFSSFRKPYARDFLESERFPPPATVYGFLLSLVGEEDRYSHAGTNIALAVLEKPQSSLVLRTVWRVKNKKEQPGTGKNKRPDYQEILSGLEIGLWVKEGPLASRIRNVCEHPESVERFGGLSLGESRDLINDIYFQPEWNGNCLWLVPDKDGEYPLPVWVDHVGSKDTLWIQFGYEEGIPEEPVPGDRRWIMIGPQQSI